jgi:CubicO group peptidase (beta-lactamase class C family)
MLNRGFLFLLISLTSLVGCSENDSNSNLDSDASKTPRWDFSVFDSKMESLLADNNLVGASVAVVHKEYGAVYEKGYGDFAADRLYLVASASKVLSTGIVMRLADNGLLDIDKPISYYLSDWGTYKENIKTAQLLSNSSGLKGLIDGPLYVPYICQYLSVGTLSDCAKKIYAADDSVDRIEPDTAFHYGGGQWQLAGGIAEVVSGKRWADLVDETYVKPCDAKSLGYTNQYERMFISGGSVASALSYPTFFQGDAANLDPSDNPSIEGGAYTTARDYGKILLMHLRGGICDHGRVLAKESVSRMQEDRIAEAYNGTTGVDAFSGYGLGWWIDREDKGVFVDSGAYGAMPWLDVPRGYGAVILIEGSTPQGRAMMADVKPLLDAVFDDVVSRDE